MANSNTFYTKRNSTARPIRATLKNPDGSAVDLSPVGTAVLFVMKSRTAADDDPEKVRASASIVSPASSGVVQYQWVAGDVNTAGQFNAEWQVNWSGGLVETFPSRGYNTVLIEADLDNQ